MRCICGLQLWCRLQTSVRLCPSIYSGGPGSRIPRPGSPFGAPETLSTLFVWWWGGSSGSPHDVLTIPMCGHTQSAVSTRSWCTGHSLKSLGALIQYLGPEYVHWAIVCLSVCLLGSFWCSCSLQALLTEKAILIWHTDVLILEGHAVLGASCLWVAAGAWQATEGPGLLYFFPGYQKPALLSILHSVWNPRTHMYVDVCGCIYTYTIHTRTCMCVYRLTQDRGPQSGVFHSLQVTDQSFVLCSILWVIFE